MSIILKNLINCHRSLWDTLKTPEHSPHGNRPLSQVVGLGTEVVVKFIIDSEPSLEVFRRELTPDAANWFCWGLILVDLIDANEPMPELDLNPSYPSLCGVYGASIFEVDNLDLFLKNGSVSSAHSFHLMILVDFYLFWPRRKHKYPVVLDKRKKNNVIAARKTLQEFMKNT